MPRRIVSSDIFKSVKFNSLSDNFTRLVYIALVTLADPYGREQANPQGIKYEMFPGFKETAEKIDECLKELHDIRSEDDEGLIILYKVDNKSYYQITLWDKYQNFNDSNRKAQSKFPSHSAAQCGTVYNLNKKNLKEDKDTTLAPTPTKKGAVRGPDIEFDYKREQFLNITQAHRERWSAAYPSVDIRAEILRLAAWAAANPSKRKKNWQSFLTRNLNRKQERGNSRDGYDDTPGTGQGKKAFTEKCAKLTIPPNPYDKLLAKDSQT